MPGTHDEKQLTSRNKPGQIGALKFIPNLEVLITLKTTVEYLEGHGLMIMSLQI